LKNDSECGLWVGGFAGTERAAVTSPVFHRLHLQTKQFGAETFIVCEIQLFAEIRRSYELCYCWSSKMISLAGMPENQLSE
jgi:hypothetical protein